VIFRDPACHRGVMLLILITLAVGLANAALAMRELLRSR
jgi:hypothetical protein